MLQQTKLLATLACLATTAPLKPLLYLKFAQEATSAPRVLLMQPSALLATTVIQVWLLPSPALLVSTAWVALTPTSSVLSVLSAPEVRLSLNLAPTAPTAQDQLSTSTKRAVAKSAAAACTLRTTPLSAWTAPLATSALARPARQFPPTTRPRVVTCAQPDSTVLWAVSSRLLAGPAPTQRGRAAPTS